jgi:hypothetical protein
MIQRVVTHMAIVFYLASFNLACGGGIPVTLTIDSFTFDFSLDDVATEALGSLSSGGSLPTDLESLPGLWPTSLPAIQYHTIYSVPGVPIDLTPDADSPEAGTYDMINQAEAAIARIELNRLIVRIEASTLTIDLPSLKLQIADDKNAAPNDRQAWQTLGTLPGASPGEVKDLEFEYAPGGESLLNQQLTDEHKEFALRVQADLNINTVANPRLPGGAATLRLILVPTFFIDPKGALESLQDLQGNNDP